MRRIDSTERFAALDMKGHGPGRLLRMLMTVGFTLASGVALAGYDVHITRKPVFMPPPSPRWSVPRAG